MGLVVLALTFAAALAMVFLAYGPRGGAGAQLAGAALVLLPALLTAAVIQGARSAPLAQGRHGVTTPWRVTLGALRFALPAEVSLGGDADKDELVIPGLPPGSSAAVTLDRRSQVLTVRDAPPGARGGLLTVAAGAAAAEPFGGTPIEMQAMMSGGAELCVSDDGASCRAGSQHVRLTVKGDTVLLSVGAGQACPLPPPGAVRSGAALAQRVFPLATYARAGCAGSARFAWDEGEPAEELLYWSERAPGWGERLMFWRTRVPQLELLAVDYNRVLLIVAQGKTRPVERRPLTLSPGQQMALSLYQIIPATALPSRERGDDNFARLQERRSLLLRYNTTAQQAALDVFLDTPQTVGLAASAHPAFSISALAGSAGTSATAVAGFSLLGKPTAAGLLTTVRPAAQVAGAPSQCRAREGALIVQGVTGISCAQLGRWFALGDPQRVLAKIRIMPLAVPVAWCAAIFALCFINLLTRQALMLGVPARIILALAEMLLVLRLLAAFEAAAVDARCEDAVAGAWLALLWLPLALELVPASRAPAALALAVRASKVLLVVLGTLLVAASAGMSVLSPHSYLLWLNGEIGKSALVSAALALPAAWLLRGAPAAHVLAVSVGQRLKRAIPHEIWSAWALRPLLRAALPLMLLALAHLALVLAGVREQLAGVRIAAVLIPLLVLAWAHWYAVVRQESPRLTLRAQGLVLLAPFAAYVPFVLAHDIGAYIYFMAFAAWLSVGAWPRLSRELALAAAVAGLVGSALLLGLAAQGAALQPLALPGSLGLAVSLLACAVLVPWAQAAAVRRQLACLPALAVLGALAAMAAGGHILTGRVGAAGGAGAPTWQDVERIEGLSGNAIRILDLLAPGAVESLGVRTAYEQRVAMAEMLAYGGSIEGRGWLRIPVPDALRQTHVDDNVTAVHLLGPFGRAGGLGVGLLLLAFAVCMHALSAGRPAGLAHRAQLAAVMLAGTSLYMLLANIAEVPFTGRNFYFLALSSHSDLLEGGLLLVIALSAFRAGRHGSESRHDREGREGLESASAAPGGQADA